MVNAGILTFHDFAMGETLPLATLQAAVLEFLKQRDAAVLFGAQAVNLLGQRAPMTQEMDLLLSYSPTPMALLYAAAPL